MVQSTLMKPGGRRVDDPRIVRIEQKVDTLTESIKDVIRIEERQANNQAWLERMQRHMDRQEERIATRLVELEKSIESVRSDEKITRASVPNRERVVWGAVSAGLALYVGAKEFFVDFFSRH